MQRLRFADLGVPAHVAHTHVTRLSGPRPTVAHRHDFYELFLVLEGGGNHHLNGRDGALAPGDLVAVRPDDGHHFATDAGGELAFVNVAVSGVWWDAFHALLGWPHWDESWRSAKLNAADTRALGERLTATYGEAEAIEFVNLWKAVRDRQRQTAATAAVTVPAWLEALRRDLTSMPDALAEPIGFWQDRAGCSAEHLSRSCRKYFGMTLRELIADARIERAKVLLRSTEKKVITVAMDCGFENMANFHRSFLARTGTTPKGWRTMGTLTVPVDSR